MVPLPAVSDMVKALEAIPLWKTIAGLPKRIADLEARVAALEKGQVARTGPRPTDCPYCGATMVLVSETNDPIMGVVGVKLHKLHCDACGRDAERRWTADRGYG